MIRILVIGMPKKTYWQDMLGAGDLSTVCMKIEGEDIRPTPEAVARYFGGPKYQMTPQTHERVCQGIQDACGMVDAVVGYRAVPVDTLDKKHGINLSQAAYTAMLPDHFNGDARYLAVFVGTLGSALETMCRELAGDNQIYQSLLLDAVGTAMLDHMGLICNDMLEMHAKTLDLFTGCRIGPGLNGVAMESQTLVFDLLDIETMGVQLNDAYIMQPAKSISGIVFFSDSPQQKPPGSKCLQCEMKHCQFRTKQRK
jgi:Vitamin B12 dependent methionine synthase, activation domain